MSPRTAHKRFKAKLKDEDGEGAPRTSFVLVNNVCSWPMPYGGQVTAMIDGYATTNTAEYCLISNKTLVVQNTYIM